MKAQPPRPGHQPPCTTGIQGFYGSMVPATCMGLILMAKLLVPPRGRPYSPPVGHPPTPVFCLTLRVFLSPFSPALRRYTYEPIEGALFTNASVPRTPCLPPSLPPRPAVLAPCWPPSHTSLLPDSQSVPVPLLSSPQAIYLRAHRGCVVYQRQRAPDAVPSALPSPEAGRTRPLFATLPHQPKSREV